MITEDSACTTDKNIIYTAMTTNIPYCKIQ